MVQYIFVVFLFVTTISINFGCMVFLSEILKQFEILLEGIKNAFNNHRMEENFETHFIDCIRHHQIIIKYA